MASPRDITAVPLTAVEEIRFAELETVVEAGLDTFAKVGSALAEIRDSKLYRQTHSSFSGYLNDRWQYSESRGYQLIAAAHVSTVVEAAGLPAPRNEAQARPLAGLTDAQVCEVWQQAVDSSSGKPTARDVADILETVEPPTGLSTHRTSRRPPLPEAFRRVSHDLWKRAESLERLVMDDRWAPNVDTCRTQSQVEVRQAIAALTHVVKQLGLGELVLLTPEMAQMSEASEPDFEAALAAARAENDLSAANVVTHLDRGQ